MYSKNSSNSYENQKFDLNLLKRLLKYLIPYKKFLGFAIILVILTTALLPTRPYLTKIAIDVHIADNNIDRLLLYAGLIFSILLITALLQFVLNYTMQWLGQKTLNDIRITLFNHILKLPVRYFDKNPVGRVVTRVTNDVEALNELFSSGVVMVIADILMILWIIAFMFFTDYELALISLSILPILAISSLFFRTKIRAVFRELRKNLSAINIFINEFISGIATIKIFSSINRKNQEFAKLNTNQKSLQTQTILYYSLFFPTIELISVLGLGLILYYSAGNLFNGNITVGILIAFTQYIEMLFRPIRDITEKYTTLQSAFASSERIFELLDEKTEETSSVKSEFRFNEKIEFDNVSFSYDKEKEILANISFTINKGEKIALVGPTGSGKTTIANLLCGLYDFDIGSIKIDGIDIREIDKKTLRSNTAIVPQDFFLFSRTIAENILFDNNGNQELLLSSTESLGALQFIESLPNQYKEILPERGMNLSTGQRQLITFSRAFASDREILIFDEATSNIDPNLEEIINKSINILFKNRTTIIISHKLSTIEKADKTILILNGKIADIGTHQELLRRNKIYSKLFELSKV